MSRTHRRHAMPEIPALPRARLLGLLLAAAALASPRLVEAQTIPSPYAFIEGRQAVDLQLGYLSTDPGQYGWGPQSGPLAGIRWGIMVGGTFVIELGTWYSPTTRDVIDLERAEGSRKIGEADMQLLAGLADLRFNLVGDRTWNRLTPYLSVGGGLLFDVAGTQNADLLLDADQRFGMGTSILARAGVGSTLLVTRHLELRGDAVFQLYQVDTPGGWLQLEPELGPLAPDQWVNGWALTLGAGWRF